MKFLYAPWRQRYINRTQAKSALEFCVFCDGFDNPALDDQKLIIHRNKLVHTRMNRFPYNTAHLLILPNRHCGELGALSSEERAALLEATNYAAERITQVFAPHGFNIGMNLGKSAGAGIPQHLHMHVLPRWDGDTNFMPVLAGTKQISHDILEVYRQLKEAW